jgi:hypothetical protein
MMFKGLEIVHRQSGWIRAGQVIVVKQDDKFLLTSRGPMSQLQILKALNSWYDAEFTKEILDIMEGRDSPDV